MLVSRASTQALAKAGSLMSQSSDRRGMPGGRPASIAANIAASASTMPLMDPAARARMVREIRLSACSARLLQLLHAWCYHLTGCPDAGPAPQPRCSGAQPC